MQMHKSINTTPFSLAPSRHPLGPNFLLQPSSLATDSFVKQSSNGYSLVFKERLLRYRPDASKHMQRSRAYYKYYLCKKVRSKPKPVPDQWVLANKPKLLGGQSTAGVMVAASYNKHQPGRAKPFGILKLKSHSVAIDENVVHSTVHVHQKAVASLPESNNCVQRPKLAHQSDLL